MSALTPQFSRSVFEELYKHGLFLPSAVRSKILALGDKALDDLHEILEDALEGYGDYMLLADDQGRKAFLHALMLAHELGDESCFDYLLDFLSIDNEDAIDALFGVDFLEETAWEFIAVYAEQVDDALESIEGFIFDVLAFNSPRAVNAVLTGLGQIILHNNDADLRDEIIAIFDGIISFILDEQYPASHQSEEGLLHPKANGDIGSILINVLLDCNAHELEERVHLLFDEKRVDLTQLEEDEVIFGKAEKRSFVPVEDFYEEMHRLEAGVYQDAPEEDETPPIKFDAPEKKKVVPKAKKRIDD